MVSIDVVDGAGELFILLLLTITGGYIGVGALLFAVVECVWGGATGDSDVADGILLLSLPTTTVEHIGLGIFLFVVAGSRVVCGADELFLLLLLLLLFVASGGVITGGTALLPIALCVRTSRE